MKNVAFDNAYASFLSFLPAQDQHNYAPCASAEDLVAALQKLDVLSQKRQKERTTRLLGGIKKLSDRLQAYFSIVNTFVQSDPQYAAIVWGAVRLAVVLASQYVSFFEKLVSMLERLADVLPTLSRVPSSAATCPAIQQLLEKIYGGILEIFQRTVKVFTSNTGRIRNTPAMIGSVLWTPFDVRFKEILERLLIYKDSLFDELSLFQSQRAEDAEAKAERERRRAEAERLEAADARRKVEDISTSSSAARRLLEQQSRDNSFKKIWKFLGAPAYAETFHQCEEAKEVGTNEWIFREPIYCDWEHAEWTVRSQKNQYGLGPSTIWLHGNPGTGKTILASSVIRHLLDRYRHINGSLDNHTVLYYFFRASDSDTTISSAWRSLLHQILQQFCSNADILDRFLFAIDEDATSRLRQDVYFDLVRQLLKQLTHVFVVLDGIDECDNPAGLISKLRILTFQTDVKILLASRPNVAALQRKRGRPSSLGMQRDYVGEDIEIYATHQLQDLVDEEMLSPHERVDELVTHVRKGADGMFLWAVLMCRYLHSPAFTPARRSRVIREIVMPEGLDGMYNRILAIISVSGDAEQRLAKQIILWLSYAEAALDERLMEQAVLLGQGDDPENEACRFEDFAATAVIVCAGLVERSTSRRDLNFVHLSIKEHFNQVGTSNKMGSAFPDLLWPPQDRGSEIARQLLTCMSMGFGNGQTPLLPACSRNNLKRRLAEFPLLAYACWQWPNVLADMHLFEKSLKMEHCTEQTQHLISALEDFVADPVAVSSWVEAIYTVSPIEIFSLQEATRCMINDEVAAVNREQNLRRLGQWANWVQQLHGNHLNSPLLRAAQRLLTFQQDINKFICEWNAALIDDPSVVFKEAAMLTESDFLFRPPSDEFHLLTTHKPTTRNMSTQPLSTTSATDREGKYSVVLTIWPSAEFEQRWHKLDPSRPYREIEDFCAGWRACVEIWAAESRPTRVATLDINLDEAEIALQMRQSFRAEAGNDCKAAFPHSIHPDSKSVIILRTVYRFKQQTPSSVVNWQSAVLPLDFTPRLRSKWTRDLEAFDPTSTKLADVPQRLLWLHREWYTYYLKFSDDGNSLFFADYQPSYLNHVAVFFLGTENDLNVRMAASDVFSNFSGMERRPPKDAVFYSSASVAFCFSNSIWLWEYLRGGMAYPLRSDLQGTCSLGMSVCGQYIVATTKNGTEVVQIPKEGVAVQAGLEWRANSQPRNLVPMFELMKGSEGHPQRQELECGSPADSDSDQERSPRGSPGSIYLTEAEAEAECQAPVAQTDDLRPTVSGPKIPEQNQSDSSEIDLCDTYAAAVSAAVAHSTGASKSVAIQRHNLRNDSQASLETWTVLHLPESASANDTSAQIKFKENTIRVFVNKRCREDYSLDAVSSTAGTPFIIDKPAADITYRCAIREGERTPDKVLEIVGETGRASEGATKILTNRDRDVHITKRLRLDMG